MTCQDNCLYYPLCRDSGFLMYHTRIKKALTLTENVESECPFKKFKNKADFVKVVRCKNCKYSDVGIAAKSIDGQEQKVWYCELEHRITDADWYCPSGERK